MSPVSRRRKRARSNRSGQRVVRRATPVEAVQCDCPACSDADFDPQSFIDDLVAGAADLVKTDDPIEAELFAATFLAAGDLAGEDFTEALDDGMLPAFAEVGTPEALAVLLAVDAVRTGTIAGAAAQRLIDEGVAAPGWADELRQPVRVGPCRRLADPAGDGSMLVCSFERAGRSYGFVVHVDHLDCDAAADIVLFPADAMDQVVTTIRQNADRVGLTIAEEVLDPDEFRWQVERALDARADHDRELDPSEFDDDLDDEAGASYHMLAVLLRARVRTLPEPTRPPAEHAAGGRPPTLDLLDMISQIAGQAQQIQNRGRRAVGARKLPSKRKKSAPPAPIYQIKVGLRGAKPPIWRRLELPADTSLADLHDIIQVAFGWYDSHLHVFNTPYGDFGIADRKLGHRAEAPVTLEQVAPEVGDRLRYTYDFGDDWEHEITVEKVLDRQPVGYPRCTGGRRAAPPEDCGGVWGYAELVEVLGDPDHPEHGDRLEWLGLASAAEFQPARFDAAEITQALTGRGHR
ncbi:plasmid pRiA4b ORF-3 family protein [Micromonospora sp. WMMD1155]|uniref:plasmid pRiA4b ORF-3 family protein n=1 Tax=Micromonospora sp. WMMD1155 TaxID=3016094 RepID=UPI00249A57D4|nr:plasmid pRiA4b ORF-3 family protein [Micromonospora sp. WMMD1155]WFE51511.1 plasmid pRiA4b ORF-3 family protein [Micromonospora sp. WMMD1155]